MAAKEVREEVRKEGWEEGREEGREEEKLYLVGKLVQMQQFCSTSCPWKGVVWEVDCPLFPQED